jgi:hypothetical protein
MATLSVTGYLRDGTVGSKVPTVAPIALPQGEQLTLNLSLTKPDNTPKDLTGITTIVRMAVRRADGTLILPAERLGTVVTAATGLCKVELPSSDTKDAASQRAFWDVWVSLDGVWHQVVLRSEFWITDAVVDLDEIVAVPEMGVTLITGLQVVGIETIPAGALIVVDRGATANRYAMWTTAMDPSRIVGAAVTACSGAGATFKAQLTEGVPLILLSDGTTTIGIGQPVIPSSTVNGRVKLGVDGDPLILGYNVGASVAATLDLPVSVLG